MKSLGWVIIQYSWCPYEKGTFGHRCCEETQGEDGQGMPEAFRGQKGSLEQTLFRCLQGERGPADTLALPCGLRHCEPIHFCCSKPPISLQLVTAVPGS